MAVGVLDPLRGMIWKKSPMTEEEIDRQRQIAQALLEANSSSAPVGHWTQGAARVLGALGGVIKDSQADAEQADLNTYNNTLLNDAYGALFGSSSPAASTMPTTTGAGQELAATSPTPAPVEISGDRDAFVQALLPAAIEESKRTGVDPRIIVAQAAQETGWGKSAPGNNFFGIKSHGQDGGNSLLTTEYVDGKPVQVRDSFRAYGSPADSVRGYGDFILQNPRYEALRKAQGLDAQLEALQASGYATDPNYSRSVGAIARSIQLPGEVAAATPEAAIEAIAPQQATSGGSDYNSPMVTYDDRGMRVERPYQTAPELPAPVEVAAPPAVAAVPQQQVAQALSAPQQSPSINPAIVRALTDPRATPQTRAVAQALLQQQMGEQQAMRQMQLKQADPAYQLGLEKSRLELEALRNPQAKIPDSVRALQMRAEAAGLQPGSREYQEFMVSGGRGPLVNVNTGNNSTKFKEKSDEAAAQRLGTVVEEGQRATSMMSDMQQLTELGKQVQTGLGAQAMVSLGPYAEALGIDIKGLGPAQAYKSIIDRLAPQMRPAGAGATSDFDARQFLSSLPNIGNNPQGNEIINQTLQAIAQNKMDAAAIARRAQREEISWQDAEDQIAKLPNPYQRFKEWRKDNNPSQPAENPLPPQKQERRTSSGVQWSIEQ